MKTRTINFNGTITTLEPLTVTMKGAVTSMGHRLPRNGGFNAEPYFPGTSIRGALRHAAHLVVVDYMTAKNGNIPFDLADHFMLAQGVDITGDVEEIASGEIDAGYKIREVNPMVSLFGRWGLSGKVGIGNAVPTSGEQWGMFGGGARTIMFERNESLIDILEPEQVERLDNIIKEQSEASIDIQAIKAEQSSLKKLLREADKERGELIRKEINELDAKIKMRKEEKSEARESIRRPIDPYEAFVAGAELSHRMVIKSATNIEVGLFLATLIRFASNPRLGGHANHNCGLVKANWQITTWNPGDMEPISLGEISITPEGVSISGAELTEMVSSFKGAENLDFQRY
ncbi:RAMP superfamily CRISPR-associated protein [Dickeya sp. NCPPB 3274]|uniref:RAMP superfamily CRISPR-associated protein n=1 Tax=Dickeya sp. NCPPB 3274 TaxID=568766 RepID=UPI00039ADAC1|nr:RAMP superfamily CRISPR-associated protein [Dickeya sp. NCPPB 3274]